MSTNKYYTQLTNLLANFPSLPIVTLPKYNRRNIQFNDLVLATDSTQAYSIYKTIVEETLAQDIAYTFKISIKTQNTNLYIIYYWKYAFIKNNLNEIASQIFTLSNLYEQAKLNNSKSKCSTLELNYLFLLEKFSNTIIDSLYGPCIIIPAKILDKFNL